MGRKMYMIDQIFAAVGDVWHSTKYFVKIKTSFMSLWKKFFTSALAKYTQWNILLFVWLPKT